MRKFNLYNLGLSLGLIPIMGLSLLLLIFWAGRNFFALDIDLYGIGLLYIWISIPVVFVGLVMFLISLPSQRTTEKNIVKSTLGLILILASYPISLLIVSTYGEISRRAYLKIQNDSNADIENISIQQSDNLREFGPIKKYENRIIFYNPHYGSTDGELYEGITENYLIMKLHGQDIKKQLPIIHLGETHKLILDKDFNIIK